MRRSLGGALGGLLLVLLLSACGQDARIEQAITAAAGKIATLEKTLKAGDLRNARLIGQYADVLEKSRPDLKPIITTLRREATPRGQAFQYLQRRHDELVKLQREYGDPELLLAEALALAEAADPVNYDAQLADVVNTLADMSDGQLPRVAAPPRSAEQASPGSRLVGNPGYGQWVNQGGTSFWEWYGMYSLFSNLMGGRMSYDRWDRGRPYSYFQDRAIDRYGSPLTQRRWGRNWGSSTVKSADRGRTTRKRSRFSRSSGASSTRSSRRSTGSLRRSSTYQRGFRGGK